MGCVYKATCTVSNKVYVGKTVHTLEHRRASHFFHSQHGTGYVFQKAISKYGKESFIWEELFQSDDNTLLLAKEMEFIAQYDCVTPNGYNLTKGGEGTLGYVFTEAQRAGMSNTQKAIFEKSPERLVQKSLQMKEFYQKHPERVEDIRNRGIKRFASQEARDVMSLVKKQFYKENPEAIATVKAAQKQFWADPANVAAQSKRRKAFFENNPEAVEQMRQGLRDYYKKNPFTEEMHAKWKQAAYQTHRDNPDLGKNHSETLRRLYADPEWRAAVKAKRNATKARKFAEKNKNISIFQ